MCTDITYLPYNHRFAYLSVVKDIATGEVVSWYLSKHLEMELVLKTAERMKKHKFLSNQTKPLLHSDQGFHYTNPLFISKMKEMKIIQSMSRKGNCIDNAPIESFFGHLKDDIDYKQCQTFEQVHAMIRQYMRYYNHERQQWNLKKMTPVEYRNHLLAKA
ncbi:IS3 family transposase [Patescibacteria group bacterium]|nr:IS3 family transposase [Patescibacteria group bacterium]